MQTTRSQELKREIASLESVLGYQIQMIALLMEEANMCDLEIEEITRTGLRLKEKLKDLRAELADTI